MNSQKSASQMECDQLLDIVSCIKRRFDHASVYLRVLLSNGKTEKFQVGSHDFRLWMLRKFVEDYGTHPSDQAFKKAISYIQSEIIENRAYDPKYRCKWKNGNIYFDLDNEIDEYVKISKVGYLTANDEENIFIKSHNQIPQMLPLANEYGRSLLFNHFKSLFRANWELALVYTITCFVPDIQHPILVLSGERGSGKSTALKLMKMLVDPSGNPLIRCNDKIENLELSLTSGHFIVLDNVSKISKRLSDLLCQNVTGGSIEKRKLYSNDEFINRKLSAIPTISCINNVAKEDDLVQRCLFVNLDLSPSERVLISELEKQFMDDVPALLHEIFMVLAETLRIIETVEPERYHRLAEFERCM